MGGRPPALLRLILELEVVEQEVMETDRRRTPGWAPIAESVTREERVEELGVDGLINEGT